MQCLNIHRQRKKKIMSSVGKFQEYAQGKKDIAHERY